MASYVQLGRGFRSSHRVAMLHPPRRRAGMRGAATGLGVAAAVFAAGLLIGRLEAGSSHASSTGLQPMQYYPR